MRLLGLGFGLAAVSLLLSSPVLAEPIQQNGPLFVNDHDGGVMPNRVSDPDFVINPDGDDPYAQAGEQAGQDQDEDGDISMYQGQDDSVPA
jgi:hypothetical protein